MRLPKKRTNTMIWATAACHTVRASGVSTERSYVRMEPCSEPGRAGQVLAVEVNGREERRTQKKSAACVGEEITLQPSIPTGSIGSEC